MNRSGKYCWKKTLSAADLEASLRMVATRLFRGISTYLREMAAIKCFSDTRVTPAKSLYSL
jgi:hypothetical protein